MDSPDGLPGLPAQIADAVSGVPKSLIPACLKALDRLVGATLDIPVAWLAQKKASIDAQTAAFTSVESAIANAASAAAGANPEIIERAVGVLVRKAYRQHENRQAVGVAMLEDLRVHDQPPVDPQSNAQDDLDDDWLNVFERYAEDASSERMQKLWGRVLSGEIRGPGKYSLRTLRFLSEFSQADGLTYAAFCNSSFADLAPTSLVKNSEVKDERSLFYLESSGLIQGATGLGMTHTMKYNAAGVSFIREAKLYILFKGEPEKEVRTDVVVLTPLGQELVSLLPGRDARAAARKVAAAMRTPAIESAFLGTIDPAGNFQPMEVIWQVEAGVVEAQD